MDRRYEQYGHKRLAVGARYGTMDFIFQRVTAVILAVYSILFLIVVLFSKIDYDSWVSLFNFTWFGGFPAGKISTSLAFIALAYHAWIGVRDIWMDYVTCVKLRISLQVLTVMWLVSSVVYFASVLWSL
ncbi:MAG: succinate dehydrogenase, hydrophobic membrane anchor protein [Alcaligenaceae bacterium]|jgi:succinate dehydrogenase / fumarate reductase membrane anchor subunit|nr:succinate dehydrogenase, hydrophobic membrane anchor protein [Alcaligenaceae bacterium]